MGKENHVAVLARLLAGSALALAPSVAAAQAPATSASPARSPVTPADEASSEIVVTAQKRTENVQDVPVAVQVVSGKQLEASGVREFSELTKIAPSLIVRPSDQPVNASLSIRGIGTFAFSIGVEPSVAVQVDDVPIAFQARAFADLSDVARIEVLRGPQSTLYGKSASAGLINIVTPGPSREWTARAHVLGTTDDEYTVGGTVSGPISPNLGIRVSVNHDDFSGNVRNLFTGKKTNGRELTSARGKLVWKLGSAFTATGGLDYIKGSTTLGRPFIRGLGPTAYLRGNPAQPPSVFAPGVNVGPDNSDVSNNAPAGTRYNGFGQSLKLEADLGGPTLVSITSHDRYKLDDFLDQDDTSVVAPDNSQGGRFKSRQWTQQVRLVSPGNQPFRYTVGLFFADVTYSRRFVRGPVFSQADWFATSGSKQAAAFGQLDYEFLPGTTATAGLRYQHEKVDYTYQDYRNGNPYFSGDAKDNFATYGHANGATLDETIANARLFQAEGYKAIRLQSAVPGLASTYGVSEDRYFYEPANGALPTENAWSTPKYLRSVVPLFEAARESLGWDVHLLHDAHHRLTPIEAGRLGRDLEPYRPFWLEDATPAENQEAFRLIRQHTTTPLAVGEIFNSIWDAKQLIQEQLIDYIRATVVHAGGITHLRRIASFADLFQIRTGCHGATDLSPVCMAAALHFDLSVPNFGIQEYMRHTAETDAVFPHAYSFADGMMHPGDAPGLGVDIDEELAAAYPYKPAFLPVNRLEDGSMWSW